MITLLSDFGLNDAYVAQMKAVILSNASEAEIVDITHGVEKHNIAVGSYLLETTVPFFPAGSIHAAVVDPGVGGTRLPLIMDCDRGTLIGPDNGLLARAADRLGFQAAYQIENREFSRSDISSTFHGRDIFAYAAAKIAKGSKPSTAGPSVASIKRLDLQEPDFSKSKAICQVLYVDSFGNVVTNISETDVERLELRTGADLNISTNDRSPQSGVVAKTYSDIPDRKLGLIQGSQGYLEVALREASAAGRLRIKPLDRLQIRFR